MEDRLSFIRMKQLRVFNCWMHRRIVSLLSQVIHPSTRLAIVAAAISMIPSFSYASPQSLPSTDLQRALYLADLYNWREAGPHFESAVSALKQSGDKRSALFAELGEIRATVDTKNLPLTSLALEKRLGTDLLLKRDKQLRLFCLAIKGDIDRELNAGVARRDWEEVRLIAVALKDAHWQNRALAEIGISAFYEGDLQTARKNVGTAVEVAERIHDIAAQARYTTVLGMALTQAGQAGQALPYFDRAIQLAQSIPDSGFPSLAYHSRLQALINLGQYDHAQSLADDLLIRHQSMQSLGPTADILFLSARIGFARGNTNGAIAELEKSVAMFRSVGLQQVAMEPEAMLAEIYRKQGSLEKAEHYALEAVGSARASGDKWAIPDLFRTLAEIQMAQGQYAEADRTFDRAEAFLEAGLTNSSTVLEKTAYIKASSGLCSEHFALAVSKIHDPAKAYSIIERVRGRVTADLLLAGSVHSAKAIAVEGTISHLQLQLMSAKSIPDVKRIRDQVVAEEQSRWITPGVNILKRRSWQTVPLPRVRQRLDASSAILEYVTADPQSYCLVISKDSFYVVPLAGKSEMDRLIDTYLSVVRQKGQGHAAAASLYNLLLRPVPEIERKEKLIVVRDGRLHQIPFDALEDEQGHVVAESHIVAHVPSVTTFYLLSLGSGERHPHPLLGIGGVPYGSVIQPVGFTGGKRESLYDLPYSRKEVLAANTAIGGHNNLLLGALATESAFKRAATQHYGVIHLAVHGIPDESDPEQAALVLLPDEKAGEDGFLHAAEIAMLHLDTNLVVLSACDTAVGPIQGEEGIATLSKSFLLAGARGVVSTLWPVDDASSLFLMEHFYTSLASGDPPEVALTRAKRALLKSFGPGAVPFYWAGFTFEGALTSKEVGH